MEQKTRAFNCNDLSLKTRHIRNKKMVNCVNRAGPRHVGPAGRLLIWRFGEANSLASLQTCIL